MTDPVDRKTEQAYLMLYLIGCALRHVTPAPEELCAVDMPTLVSVSRKHSLGALTAYALRDCDSLDAEALSKHYWRAVRKGILLNAERSKVLEKFDRAGIFYLPLKGISLQACYPEVGLREMSDNDILIDKEKAEQAKRLMEEMGYTCTMFGCIHHDVYEKKPLYSYELHRSFFDEANHPAYKRYYRHPGKLMVKDEDNRCGYHLTNEEFYLHTVFHSMSAHDSTGIGLRVVIDNYLYRQAYKDRLDFAYIEEKLRLIDGAAEFEQKLRSAADAAMNRTPDEMRRCQALDSFIRFGNASGREILNQNNLEKAHAEQGIKGKYRYVSMRMKKVGNALKEEYPAAGRHPILMPGLYLRSFGKMILHHRGEFGAEVKALMTYKKKNE